MSSGFELVFILGVFLALLCVGMTIPFAILVPSVLYLLTHAGLAGLKGLGLVSWGSMDSFTLSAIPLFILMAEILQESKLSLRVYRGLSILVAWMPGGLLQTNIETIINGAEAHIWSLRRLVRDAAFAKHPGPQTLMARGGLEPPTPRFSVVCSTN